ncbi:MAG: hypothetical protein AB1938_27860 [Myxococcota bacterium]
MTDEGDSATPARSPGRGELLRSSAKASQSGSELLFAGLSVGAIGLAGAALGAVCPLCVVATPALLSAGAVQKLRAKWLERKAEPAPAGEPR